MDGYLVTHTERSSARSIPRMVNAPVAHTPQNNGVWQIWAFKFCIACLAWQGNELGTHRAAIQCLNWAIGPHWHSCRLLTSVANPMQKERRPIRHFSIGVAHTGKIKQHLYIETGPRLSFRRVCPFLIPFAHAHYFTNQCVVIGLSVPCLPIPAEIWW